MILSTKNVTIISKFDCDWWGHNVTSDDLHFLSWQIIKSP